MITLKRILVPTDFSENSESAIEFARTFADEFNSEIHLLHVLASDTAVAMGSDGFFSVSDDLMQEIRDGVTSRLQETAQPLKDAGETVVQEVREGTPFVEIVKYAKSNEIDLIILGTHGRTGIPHLLIGSVAEKVVRKAPCPVLTVPLKGRKFELP